MAAKYRQSRSPKKGALAALLAFGAAFGIYSGLWPLRFFGDYALATLVSSVAAWLSYTLFSGLDTSQKAPHTRAVQKTGDTVADTQIGKGYEMIRQIRLENEQIHDEHLSKQIDEMEAVCKRIFAAVAEQPKKAPQIRRFMDYYLPTTLKMLTGYRKMDEKQVEGLNAQATRQKVRDSMDMVVSAFHKQLDALYQDEMMDISTDIDVMETLLKQDSLVDSGVSMRKDNAQSQAGTRA